MRREFSRVGLGYVLRVPDFAAELAVGRLGRRGSEMYGELSVTCALPAISATGGHVHSARFNLSSSTTRTSVAKLLSTRASAKGLDWYDLLEDLCRRVLEAERQGEPIEDVGILPIPIEESYRVAPIMPLGQVTILYGDGGVGKSTLAVALAVSVQTGVAVIDGWAPRKGRVLYLDWEAGKASINRRVRGVAMGASIPNPVSISYLDCRRRGPLRSFAEDLASQIDSGGFDLVVVDSIGMASGTGHEGGDANETAIRLFEAFGYLGTTVLAVDHVSKSDAEAENRRSRPYGSVYKSLLARSTLEVRRAKAGDGTTVIGVYDTKANDRDQLAPLALAVEHGADGSIRYQKREALPEQLAKGLHHGDRIAAFLAEGHATSAEIAEALDVKENLIRAVLSRDKTRFNKLGSGKWELIPMVVPHAV